MRTTEGAVGTDVDVGRGLLALQQFGKEGEAIY